MLPGECVNYNNSERVKRPNVFIIVINYICNGFRDRDLVCKMVVFAHKLNICETSKDKQS